MRLFYANRMCDELVMAYFQPLYFCFSDLSTILFNYALPVSHKWMTMNAELKTIWKKAVVVYFKVLFRHSLGKSEENSLKTSVKITGLRAKI
jgi:hypothetical protein